MSERDLWKLINYNSKLLFSNKHIVSIFFSIFIALAINFVGTNTYNIIFESYLPILAAILFSDLMLIDSKYQMYEFVYLTKLSKNKILAARILFSVLFIILFFLITLISVRIIYGTTTEVDYFKLLVAFIINSIFWGVLSLTVTNRFKSVPIGLMAAVVYWVIWITNYEYKSVFNPFSVSANMPHWWLNKILYMVITLLLLMLNRKYILKSKYN